MRLYNTPIKPKKTGIKLKLQSEDKGPMIEFKATIFFEEQPILSVSIFKKLHKSMMEINNEKGIMKRIMILINAFKSSFDFKYKVINKNNVAKTIELILSIKIVR